MFVKFVASLSNSSQSDNERRRPSPSRQQRRLSKPPTNRFSTTNLRNGIKDIQQETQPEDAQAMEGINTGDVLLRQETREALRAELCGPTPQLRQYNHRYEQQGDDDTGWQDTRRQSMYRSQTSPPTARPSVDRQRLPSVSMHRMSLASHVETAVPDIEDWSPQSPVLTTSVSASAPHDMYIPIRRRSLLTPGLATRVSTAAAIEPLTQHESLDRQEEDCQIGVHDYSDEFEWKLPTFVERAQTPSDLDYSHLGGFDLGALRITNGCPSPVHSDCTSVHIRSRSAFSDLNIGAPAVAAASLAATYLRSELETTLSSPAETRPSDDVVKVAAQPIDRTSTIADGYISSLPLSPYLAHSSRKTPEPHLETTTKATEFDDDLFEDEAVALSPVAAEKDPSNTLQVIPDFRPATSRTSTDNSIGKSDSGYSSSSSTYSTIEARKMKLKTFLQTRHNESLSSVVIDSSKAVKLTEDPPKDEGLRPSLVSRPVSLPTLKVATPTKVNESTNSLATYDSSFSVSSAERSKPRKLQKRPKPDSRSSSSITVQGYREMVQAHIPPIPAEIAYRLSQRASLLPELDRTYSSLDKAEADEASRPARYTPIQIRFPSPVEEDSETETRRKFWIPGRSESQGKPRPTPVRSYTTFSKSEMPLNNQKLPGEMDRSAALAIARGDSHIFGYPTARSVGGPRPNPTHRHSYAGPSTSYSGPRQSMTGMDAETAAQLARQRSKILLERQEPSWTARFSIFNDRGGVPGRSMKPKSVGIDAPPMPPLPGYLNNSKAYQSLETLEQPQHRPVNLRHSSSNIRGPRPQMAPSHRRSSTELRKELTGRDTQPANVWTSVNIPGRHPSPAVNYGDSENRPIPAQSRAMSMVSTTTSNFAPRPSDQVRSYSRPTSFLSPPNQEPMSFRRPSPAPSALSVDLTPQIGRYSGGLQYGYEAGAGLGGSAGTRSASGQTYASRKGMQLSESWGVDLSDVPIIAGVKRVESMW